MSAFDFSGNVASFDNSAEEPLILLRHQGVTLDKGTVVDEGTFVNAGLIPPYFSFVRTDKSVEPLEGGDRVHGDMKLYTTILVSVGDEANGILPDRVIKINTGEIYEALEVNNWLPQGKYCRTILTRREAA